MPQHTVTFTLPEREVKRADIVFRVKRDGKIFGTFEVSNGGLEWTPARKQKRKSRVKVTWTDFDKWVVTRNGEPAPQ